MRRFPWDILLALFIGIGLGLVYAWMISPLNVTDSDPSTLRADFKDQYRSAIAAAFAAGGNLPRAQARLVLLGDADSVEALNAQAQRMLARGDSAQAADQVAALAAAIEAGETGTVLAASPVSEALPGSAGANSATLPSPSPSPDPTFVMTETTPTVRTGEMQTSPPSTPRPTNTVIPTPGTPFKLTSQDEICDPNLPEGLLQVIVLNANRRQMPGMEIDITWEGDADQFFTGLKPELGNGYADFVMAPEVSYTVQLARRSDIAAGLSAPTCQTPAGESFTGGIKLTFQQP